jgi:hypothetical protein
LINRKERAILISLLAKKRPGQAWLPGIGMSVSPVGEFLSSPRVSSVRRGGRKEGYYYNVP